MFCNASHSKNRIEQCIPLRKFIIQNGLHGIDRAQAIDCSGNTDGIYRNRTEREIEKMGARIDLWLYMQCSTCIYAVCIYRHYRHHRAHIKRKNRLQSKWKRARADHFYSSPNCFLPSSVCRVPCTPYNQIELLHYYLSFCIDSWIRLFLFAKWGSILKWLHSFRWCAVGRRWWWKKFE